MSLLYTIQIDNDKKDALSFHNIACNTSHHIHPSLPSLTSPQHYTPLTYNLLPPRPPPLFFDEEDADTKRGSGGGLMHPNLLIVMPVTRAPLLVAGPATDAPLQPWHNAGDPTKQ